MDKRDLSRLFTARLRELVDRQSGGLTGFARATGVDRSALTQFLAPGADRLPRAETLRQIAERTGTTADWLLGLTHADEGGRELTPSVEIESAVTAEGTSPLERWHREAAGHKIRYVPSSLPDIMRIPGVMDFGEDDLPFEARRESGEAVLATVQLGETDVEIAMARQTLEDFARGAGVGRDVPAAGRRDQLAHMARLTEAHYPTLRLHLYDARRTYSAPFTVFGPIRAAIYLGPGYLVLTAADEVRRLARIFDGLVRDAVIGPDRVHRYLATLAESVEPDGVRPAGLP